MKTVVLQNYAEQSVRNTLYLPFVVHFAMRPNIAVAENGMNLFPFTIVLSFDAEISHPDYLFKHRKTHCKTSAFFSLQLISALFPMSRVDT